MQPNLDISVRPSRVRSRRFSFPALTLGLCALIFLPQHAALGQAQMGAAETCFDEGPDHLPAIPNTPVPSLKAAMPVRVAQLLQPAHTMPARALSHNTRLRSNWTSKKKAPEGTLTAAR